MTSLIKLWSLLLQCLAGRSMTVHVCFLWVRCLCGTPKR